MPSEKLPTIPPRIKNVPRNLKPYYLCLLVKGERWNETEGGSDLMPLHLAFLREQMESRRFLVAGPVMDGGHIVGMSLVEAASEGEAVALAGEDPAVKTGRLAVELHPVFLPSLDAIRVEY